ncbi:transporter associated domain-containing protein [Celeribacter halophilus]|uniref:Magnesium and cobalt transporter n=1 Tax=Celeribacter halophilus TaxID=576117 RepID=A0A1I3SB77_9RHOB|nr:hemolysin family protein [Celeribacter halophilus]PZX11567.1 magnesium and cobalt transporter [Celeribacter halophilus]SFJ56063.1 magnesium and cobalt transporter [Celeribacter halophilus]
MGDTEPGSSMAAQSAPADPISRTQSHSNRAGKFSNGWFDRLRSAFSSKPDKTPTIADTPAPAAQVPPAQRPGMVNLRRMRVDDVAVPKADIVAVPCDIKMDDLVKVFRESGMTRLPVYNGTLDTPVGLVHLKDVALGYGFNGKGAKQFDLNAMLRPLIYAPPSMPIGILLQKMQSDRMHMALVIDEYGGVDGLVTLEDLVEQVIGEIEDEHDVDEDVFWTQSAPGVFIAQAKAPLEEFEAAIGLRLADEDDEEEIDTLGGLVFLLSGRVPARGEVIPHPSGTEFEVIDADPRRIKRLRVRLPSAVKPKLDA